jgi:hypothetical protein
VVGPLQVVCLAAGQEEVDRVAQRVDQGVDFLPVVKGEKGGAVTPPERACLIRIRYGHRLWRRLLVGYTSDPVEPRAVLAAVKTASRRFRPWPSASLDTGGEFRRRWGANKSRAVTLACNNDSRQSRLRVFSIFLASATGKHSRIAPRNSSL